MHGDLAVTLKRGAQQSPLIIIQQSFGLSEFLLNIHDNSFSLLMQNCQNGMTMEFVILLALNDKTN